MDRLTRYELGETTNAVMCNHIDSDCNDSCIHGICKWNDKALMKLKAYEDSELSPEQISLREDDIKLLQRQNKEQRDEIFRLREELKGYRDADEQGLIVILPCEIGDTVYIINSSNQICERECCGFSLYTDIKLRIWYRWTSKESRMSNAGKLNIDVFLTREAAESALKGGDPH